MPVQNLSPVDDRAQNAQLAPIDFAHLSKFTLGNSDLEREVLELFIAHAPRYIAKMKASTGASDWHEATHTLKGSAAAVGAWYVAELATRAEALRHDFDQQSRARMIDQLTVAVSDAAQHIEFHFSRR